jgi:hypothetical protein
MTVTFIPSFMKIRYLVQKLFGGELHRRQTDRQTDRRA